jgi:FkbM family methyltransferase
VVSNGPEWTEIVLDVPAAQDRGTLVIRKASAAPCRLKIRLPDSAAALEASPAGAQIAATSALFGAAAAIATDPPGPDLRALAGEALAARLAAAAAAFDAELVVAGDPAIIAIAASLDAPALVAVAQGLVLPAKRAPLPGWKFDWAVTRPEIKWQFRTAVWRAMRDRCPEAAIEMPWLEDTTVAMPLGSDLSLALFTTGRFEPNAFAVLAQILRPGDLFVDVGANEGLYSLAAARLVGPSGRVVAVEPSPREIARLRANVARNDLGSSVTIVDTALAAAGGWASLAIAEDAHGGQNAFADRMASNLAIDDVRLVPTISLDMLVTRLGGRQPAVIKIDVEGAEYEVLAGAEKVLAEARPFLFVEVARGGRNADRRVVELLLDSRYALYAIDDERGAVRPLERDDDWTGVDNILAAPSESLRKRWPAAPRRA